MKAIVKETSETVEVYPDELYRELYPYNSSRVWKEGELEFVMKYKKASNSIFSYDIRKDKIEEHEIIDTDECKFHHFSHNGNICSYNSRGATVQLLSYKSGYDNKYFLVSTDKASLGWISDSYKRVISDLKANCMNAIINMKL